VGTTGCSAGSGRSTSGCSTKHATTHRAVTLACSMGALNSRRRTGGDEGAGPKLDVTGTSPSESSATVITAELCGCTTAPELPMEPLELMELTDCEAACEDAGAHVGRIEAAGEHIGRTKCEAGGKHIGRTACEAAGEHDGLTAGATAGTHDGRTDCTAAGEQVSRTDCKATGRHIGRTASRHVGRTAGEATGEHTGRQTSGPTSDGPGVDCVTSPACAVGTSELFAQPARVGPGDHGAVSSVSHGLADVVCMASPVFWSPSVG
jgi:hypothetical protein